MRARFSPDGRMCSAKRRCCDCSGRVVRPKMHFNPSSRNSISPDRLTLFLGPRREASPKPRTASELSILQTDRLLARPLDCSRGPSWMASLRRSVMSWPCRGYNACNFQFGHWNPCIHLMPVTSLGACFGACSAPTLLPFTAIPCYIDIAFKLFILRRLCQSVRRCAAYCNILGFGLKIRRRQLHGGSTPLPAP